MPLRFAPPYIPPVYPAMPRAAKAQQQQQAQSGGGGLGDLLKRLGGTIGQGRGGQADQMAQAMLGARTGSGPTVGSFADSYLPPDAANTMPDDVLPEDLGMTDQEFNDALGSAQTADALSGFNWAGGV